MYRIALHGNAYLSASSRIASLCTWFCTNAGSGAGGGGGSGGPSFGAMIALYLLHHRHHRRLWPIVYCLLSSVYRLLSIVSCLLSMSLVSCLLSIVYRLLSIVYCTHLSTYLLPTHAIAAIVSLMAMAAMSIADVIFQQAR